MTDTEDSELETEKKSEERNNKGWILGDVL